MNIVKNNTIFDRLDLFVYVGQPAKVFLNFFYLVFYFRHFKTSLNATSQDYTRLQSPWARQILIFGIAMLPPLQYCGQPLK